MSSVAAVLMLRALQTGHALETPVPDTLRALAFFCKSDSNRKSTFAEIRFFTLTLLFKYYDWNIRITYGYKEKPNINTFTNGTVYLHGKNETVQKIRFSCFVIYVCMYIRLCVYI